MQHVVYPPERVVLQAQRGKQGEPCLNAVNGRALPGPPHGGGTADAGLFTEPGLHRKPQARQEATPPDGADGYLTEEEPEQAWP